MKRKLFFITFLMLFCSSMFGQHWTMTEADEALYNSNMTVTTVIEINGEEQRRTDLEIAAFCNNGLRGVGEIQYKESTDRYIATITILGGNVSGETINFKLFDPELDNGKELNTTFTVNFVTDEVIGKPSSPISINFNNTYWSIDISNLPITSMQYTSYIKIDGEEQRRTDLELAAFSGETLCGWVQPIYSSKADKFVAFLTIYGEQGDEITLKLYDPELEGGKVLTADSPFGFLNNNMVGNPTTPLEFQNNPVARIGEEGNAARYFSSLEAAVDAAQPGETVVLLQDVNLTETLTIDKSITIDLNDNKVTLSTGGNMIKSNVTIKNGNLAIADVDTQTTGNSNCFISTNVGASLTFDDINMTGNGYTTHWAVLCAMSSSTSGSTINITNSTVTLSNEKGSAGGFIKDQSGVDNYSQINISNSTLTLTNVSRGFTGAKVILNDVDLTITGGEHGINGSELVIENGSNVSISNGTGRAITLNKFDASIAGSNVTISNMGEGGIRYKTANTLTVDANSTLSETTAHADVDNAKLNDKVVRGKESQMSTVKVENGVTTVINPVSGQVAYRAYIEDSENREAVKVDLQNVNALNSLAVKLYDANGNLLTTTTYRAGAVEAPEYLTCNIVLSGTASSSWETLISAEKLTVDNYPHKAELVVDGDVINTFENILGNATDAAAYQLPAYKALGCVYKAASITKESKTEYYGTLAAAVNAAQDGDEIVLLDNVTDVDATISKKITLNLNEKIINDAYIIVKSEVNIKNGSIKNVNESYPLVVQDGGKLTVDAVNIEASKSDRAIWVREGGELVFNSGSILATKGEYNTKTSLIAAIYTDTNTDVTINGGTITVDTPENKAIGIFGNYTNANVTINGGKISTSGKNYSYGINVDGDITVNGGEIVTNEKGYGYSSGIRYGNNYALVSATGDVTITGGNITTNGYSGYIVNVGRTYSSNDQTVSITGGTFVNNLSEVEMTTGGHKAPVFIWEGSASKVTATITDGDFTGFSADFLREANAETTLAISGGTFDSEINEEYIAPGFKLVENANGTYGVVVDPDYGMVAKIGETRYATLSAAFAAAAQTEELTTIELLPVTIEEDDDINTVEKTIKLPATLKNVIVKGADNNTSILKNLTIQNAQGGTYDMSNITFDGVVFDNSNIVLTGWRTGFESLKNLIVKNCIFRNIVRSSTNLAAVHINVAADKAVNGFTFINNVIDGVTGAQNSGIYGQFTGEVIVKDNVINNVAFRPYVIQLTTDDGIADVFTVTGNTFSGSAAGRAQGLGNNAEGTDAVTLTVSNNIFKDITNAQQICYWNFNEATTTATLEKNYYDIDVLANPNRIYYNGPAQNISELSEMGIFPIYTELKDDGTINEESLFNPVAYNGTVAYKTLAEAFAGQGGTIVLLENIELTEGLTVAADKTFTLDLNGKTITGTPTEAAAFAVIANKGNLTVTDNTEAKEGKILCNHNLAPSTGYAVNTITNSGALTIEAGTIENKSTYTSSNQIGYAIDNNSTTGNAVVTIKGGNVTASGSTYYDGIRQFCNSTTLENSVTIEGGEVSTLWIQNPSNDNEKDVKGSFVITGGTLGNLYLEPSANFSGSISGGHVGSISRHQSGDNDIVSFITGGTFGMDVTEFCAFNYVCTSNGNGTYGIEYKPQEEDAFVISTLHELEAFRDAVNAGNTFEGQTVVLSGNVDLAPTRAAAENWIPIGTSANPFKGTFDGGNNTISNLNVVGKNNVGLFGYATEANIKNVKIVNANVKGTDCVAALIGQGYASTYIDNCHVSGSIKVEGQTNVGGIVGKYYARVTNSSVIGDGVATSYVKGTHEAENFEGDNIGGIMGHAGENNTHSGNTVKNITISGTRKVGGLIGTTDRATDIDACLVDNVVIGCTADENYANDKASTTTLGGLVGNYYGESTGGTVTNTVVKNVTFNVGNAKNVGPIVGGNRTTPDAESIGGVTASGNLIYMSTITGSTNTYLMNAVAKIGETEYYTLFDAVAAAQGEITTITLISDTSEEFAIDNTATAITLDLNGKKLTGAILPSDAKLTVKNGTINNNNSNVSAIEITSGELHLEDVNIASARHAVRIDGAVEATIDGGEYKLNATAGMTQHVFNISGDAVVTITDGTFVGPKETSADSGSALKVKSGATVTIEGGDFSGGKNNTLSVDGTLIVKGGTFDQVVKDSYLANGYVCQKNADNKYEVFFAVASIKNANGTLYYASLQAAINAAAENETVTMLADVTPSEQVVIAKAITLDLNAKTITGTGSLYRPVKVEGGNSDVLVKIENGTIETKDVTTKPDQAACVLVYDGADVTFNNVVMNGSHYGVLMAGYGQYDVNNNNTSIVVDGENTKITAVNAAIIAQGAYPNISVEIKAGEVTSTESIAIYQPTKGTLAIKGGTITGTTAIYVKAGNLNVTAGTIKGVGDKADYAYDQSGAKATGDAIVIESCDYGGYGKPVVSIAGGTITSVNAEPVGSYQNGDNDLVENFISGGTYNKQIDEDLCVVGFVCEENTDGTYSVKFADYIVLPEDVTAENYKEKFGTNTVTDGINYYATLQAAVEAVVGTESTLYCKPGANVGSLQHAPVTSTLTVYGNDAYVSDGGERDFDLGNTDPSYGQDITSDMTLTVMYLDGCGAWGAKATEHTVNLVFENCDNMGKVFITGQTGILNITMTDCAFEGVIAEALYSNADGNITLTNVDFSNLNKAVNLNHNAAGTQTVTMTGCTFTDCGNDVSADQIPVRVLTSVAGGKSELTVENCTFTGTPTGGADILLDYGVGLTEANITETNAKVVIERKNNEPEVHNVVDTQEYAFNNLPFVAEVEDEQFTSLQAAIDAADGKTVVVLDNITLTETLTVAAGTTVTLDLNGKIVSQTKEQTTGYQMILNDGNLTIVDNTNEKLGKISYTDSGNGGEYVSNTITNRGTITLKSGTIENLSSQTVAQNGYPYAVDSSIWGDASEVNTIVEGGKVHGATYSAIRLRADSTSEPVNVTVSGGEIVGTIEVQVPSSTVAGKGALVISGGKLSNSGTSNVLFFFGSGASAENIEVSVTGGEFTGNITISSSYPIGDNFNKNFITGGTFSTNVNEYCHEYYDAIQGDDNLWRVEQVLFAQTTSLQGGWNWFSSYVDIDGATGLSLIQSALGSNGVQIKNPETGRFSQYSVNPNTLEAIWSGSLRETSSSDIYAIRTLGGEEITHNIEIVSAKLDPADPSNTVTIRRGWNYVAYPLDVQLSVNAALGFTPTVGDVIKSKDQNSIYYGTWVGQLTNMIPGQGYMYQSNNSSIMEFNFEYPSTNNRESTVLNIEAIDYYWNVDAHNYSGNMTMIAMLETNDEIMQDGYEIAAFANGECRGTARPVYVESIDAYILVFTVNGEDVEELSFKCYDVNTGVEYNLNNRINYSNDAVVGSIDEPYIFNLDMLNIGETSVENISIYPNPTTTGREIQLQAVCDKVEVFNALGVKIAEYSNVDSIDAIETAGVYVIRLTIDNSARNCRLIVK